MIKPQKKKKSLINHETDFSDSSGLFFIKVYIYAESENIGANFIDNPAKFGWNPAKLHQNPADSDQNPANRHKREK